MLFAQYVRFVNWNWNCNWNWNWNWNCNWNWNYKEYTMYRGRPQRRWDHSSGVCPRPRNVTYRFNMVLVSDLKLCTFTFTLSLLPGMTGSDSWSMSHLIVSWWICMNVIRLHLICIKLNEITSKLWWGPTSLLPGVAGLTFDLWIIWPWYVNNIMGPLHNLNISAFNIMQISCNLIKFMHIHQEVDWQEPCQFV